MAAIASPKTVSSDGGLLRFALKLDAVVTSVNGLAYLAFAPLLEEFLGIPRAVEYPVGAFLLVFGIVVGTVGTRPAVSRAAAGFVAELNVVWAAGSVVVAATGVLPATTVGTIWIIAQAFVVGGFAALQLIGRRRAA